MKGNVSVGLPIDLCTLYLDKFKITNEIRIKKNDIYVKRISDGWGKTLKKGIKELPSFDFKKY